MSGTYFGKSDTVNLNIDGGVMDVTLGINPDHHFWVGARVKEAASQREFNRWLEHRISIR